MKKIKGLGIVILIIALWQACAVSGCLNPMVFPSAFEVAESLREGILEGNLIVHFGHVRRLCLPQGLRLRKSS